MKTKLYFVRQAIIVALTWAIITTSCAEIYEKDHLTAFTYMVCGSVGLLCAAALFFHVQRLRKMNWTVAIVPFFMTCGFASVLFSMVIRTIGYRYGS